MAHQLHNSPLSRTASINREVSWGVADQRMRKDSLTWFSAVVLAILTAATVVFAVINFEKERQFRKPSDGAWWVEKDGALIAKAIAPGGPAEKAGIKAGDELLAIDDQPITSFARLDRKLYQRTSFLQYATFQFFAITILAALPAKMLLRLVFRVKYVLITPWFNI